MPKVFVYPRPIWSSLLPPEVLDEITMNPAVDEEADTVVVPSPAPPSLMDWLDAHHVDLALFALVIAGLLLSFALGCVVGGKHVTRAYQQVMSCKVGSLE
jgi:hypothetical protein